ncbi:MAG: hypothetical protein WBK43_03055 [Prolixibacteraceae bacterium]|jgi:hypothetical protein|nr:hypothetical protein [Prolixibacteraceae bacterium]MDI9565061.1 hypothetical protein [Bacteroidota bacterium]NLT00505.1 hypothetical protein [Bacteroidales bacterium]OQB80984.1 MAG: hypothetical protein BWX87_00997 [Bacteroidetes bacterium ADurb.Bin123]HNU77230.1 hypothetical protein [Prolixibacteraceae bacterium]
MKRRHTAIFLILLSAILATVRVTGQPVKATALIDSSRILIGDQVNLRVELEKPSTLQSGFIQVPDTLSGKIEILERSPIDTTFLDDKSIRLVQNFRITCFDSGEYRIPPLRVDLLLPDRLDSIFTNDLVLKVLTLEIDTTRGPADIKMPYDAPLTLKEVIPYIMGIILAATLLFLILYSVRRKKRNLPLFIKPEKPKEPPHIIALRELDRIKEEKLWQKDKVKAFYSEVTAVLRTYIENRFGIHAMEQTTGEIIASFNTRGDLIQEKTLGYLQQILPTADLVKFAKYQPLPDDHNLTLINAYFFVNETKIEETVNAGKAEEQESKEQVPETVHERTLNQENNV